MQGAAKRISVRTKSGQRTERADWSNAPQASLRERGGNPRQRKRAHRVILKRVQDDGIKRQREKSPTLSKKVTKALSY